MDDSLPKWILDAKTPTEVEVTGAKGESTPVTGTRMALFGNFIRLDYHSRVGSLLLSEATPFVRRREAQLSVFH